MSSRRAFDVLRLLYLNIWWFEQLQQTNDEEESMKCFDGVDGCIQWRSPILGLLILALLALPGSAFAQSWSWFVVSNTDVTTDEVWEGSFSGINAFIAGNRLGGGYTAMNVHPAFGFKAFFADKDQFYIVLESDADAGSGAEVYLLTYDSMADVFANNYVSAGYSTIDLSPGYSISGFAADGNDYYMLLESDADAPAGSEFYVWTYNTIADFLNHSGSFEALNLSLSPSWSMGAFAADGEYFYLIAETDAGAPAGSEFWVYQYDSLADVVAHTPIGASASQQILDDAWSHGGMGISVPLFADGFESSGTGAWSATVQ